MPHNSMKEIKLSGRERAVIKAIDESTGSTGAEIVERTKLDASDLLAMLNGLADVGYVEAFAPNSELPFPAAVPEEQFLGTRFEVNPSYAMQLREAMKR